MVDPDDLARAETRWVPHVEPPPELSREWYLVGPTGRLSHDGDSRHMAQLAYDSMKSDGFRGVVRAVSCGVGAGWGVGDRSMSGVYAIAEALCGSAGVDLAETRVFGVRFEQDIDQGAVLPWIR